MVQPIEQPPRTRTSSLLELDLSVFWADVDPPTDE